MPSSSRPTGCRIRGSFEVHIPGVFPLSEDLVTTLYICLRSAALRRTHRAHYPLGLRIPPLPVMSATACLLLYWRGAREGLRTLLTAKTERSEEQYSKWLTEFQAAETSMQGREEKVRHRTTSTGTPCQWPLPHARFRVSRSGKQISPSVWRSAECMSFVCVNSPVSPSRIGGL